MERSRGYDYDPSRCADARFSHERSLAFLTPTGTELISRDALYLRKAPRLVDNSVQLCSTFPEKFEARDSD